MSRVIDPLTDEELEAWAQALESGEYEQAQGRLSKEGCYCCLGVLAHMRGQLDKKGRFLGSPYYEQNLLMGGAQDYYLSYETQEGLADRNDNGASFKEIATYIREELIGGAQ